MTISQQDVLSILKNAERELSAYDITKILCPDLDKDEFKVMNQRVVSTLNRLSEKNFVYRHYTDNIIMWGLDKPPLVITRGHRKADQDMIDRVMRNLEKSPGGMTLGEMLDDVYGTNVKIDLLAYNRVKLALKKLTMDGKIIMDNKNGKNKWMIP